MYKIWKAVTISMNRVEDIIEAIKLTELLKGNKDEEKNESKDIVKIVLIVVGAIVLIGVIAFAIYRFVTPDYLEDFDDDFDEDFDDDFFEDEDIVVEDDKKEDK